MTSQLQKKVDFAIKLLQSIPTDDGIVEVSYSGGKDSDVILELVRMSGIKYRAIYKNTTIDPPGTIKHCKDNRVEIINPDKTFFQLIESNGMPSRYYRFCCKELKEYKIGNRSVQGIRRSESTKRAKRYHEPEVCRLYPHGEKVKIYLPILEWTAEEVAEFVAERGIKCHPLYYDKYGNFHPERRLGCIGCPLQSFKKRIKEFLKYPKMLRLWIIHAQKYLDTHTHVNTYKTFEGSACNWMFKHLFDKNNAEYQNLIGGGDFPRNCNRCKDVLGGLL